MSDALNDYRVYDNPLIGRYASRAMSELWGPRRKFSTWRRLWVALAEAEQELGLPITAAQIAEMVAHVDDIDFAAAEGHERRLRHDVMAHVHAFGDVCPRARAIIHLGATSCFVTDNTDLMLMREALGMVAQRLAAAIDRLAGFAERRKHLACLAFTHLQPAQPTTVGKRATLWAYDLAQDLEEVEHRLGALKARGLKGASGTQASFLKLFNGDHARVKRLEQLVAEKMGFTETYAVTGQTYSRKVDAQVIDALTGIAGSAHKAATDWRLLQGRKELEEPFEESQIGSSAMAYKRNPMRSERICSLARFVCGLQGSASATVSTQWFERTLDDSAIRRLMIPQAFLAIDAILLLYSNVAGGFVVYPRVIGRNLAQELPFMATEDLLMTAVAEGGDRQELHERIRRHSQAAARVVKEEGGDNDLLARLGQDPAFAGLDLVDALETSRYVGRAPEQVDEFLEAVVAPIRRRYGTVAGLDEELRV